MTAEILQHHASFQMIDPQNLHWPLTFDEQVHVLDLLPGPRGISIFIDGRRSGILDKPTAAHRRTECAIGFGDHRIVASLDLDLKSRYTDVFLDGRSARDGQDIQEIRGPQPPPGLRAYDRWFRPPVSGPIDPRLMTRWVAIISLVAIAIFLATPIKVGAVRGVAITWLSMVWFWDWYVLVSRTNRWLLQRPSLGDVRRMFIFFGVFLGYPAIGLMVIVGLSSLGLR